MKSAKGLLQVVEKDGQIVLNQEVTELEEQEGLLKTIFINGQIKNFQTLNQIRQKIDNYANS